MYEYVSVCECVSVCVCQCIGKYGSTSYIGMTRKKMAANRKGIGRTTLKHACNSTTNTRTKYLLVVMHKTHSSVWLTFVRRENETVQNCTIVLKNSSSSSSYVTISGKTNLLAEIEKLGFCYPRTQSTLGFVVVPVASQ